MSCFSKLKFCKYKEKMNNRRIQWSQEKEFGFQQLSQCMSFLHVWLQFLY